LVIRLTGSAGNALINAPITVSTTAGGGKISGSLLDSPTQTSVFHSDANGMLTFYYQQGPNWGTNGVVQVKAGKTAATFTETASFQIGYWTFNANSGISITDVSNTGNTATLIGGVSLGKGFDGTQSITLDGVSGYVEIPASPTLALGSGSLSCTAWVRLPQTISLSDDTKVYPVVTFGDANSDTVSLAVRGGGRGLEAPGQYSNRNRDCYWNGCINGSN